MDAATWAPFYADIIRDFGYDPRADEKARDVLDALLADRLTPQLPRISGEAIVLGPNPVGRVPEGPLFVADPRALPPVRPFAIVTDLDGDVPLQIALNALGVPLVVHGHGDNIPALREHVPQLRGPVVGTCQCAPQTAAAVEDADARSPQATGRPQATRPAPSGRVSNYGGFTDGDRACCVAVELGASSLRLVGFDFAEPIAKPGRARDVKMRKLAWARRIIDALGVPTSEG